MWKDSDWAIAAATDTTAADDDDNAAAHFSVAGGGCDYAAIWLSAAGRTNTAKESEWN